jgi:hypothetical protein
MTKKFLTLYFSLALLVFSASVQAQYESFVHEGEFGLQIGGAHYFGDLNTQTGFKKPSLAAGVFYRKQINPYVALRLGMNYARVGYADSLQSSNEFQRRRNLSFESNLFEVALQGDFNFFKFNPFNPTQRFTPYLTFGIGFFTYNPYTFLDGTKYFLRPLGTEGQNNPGGPKAYGSAAMMVPFGMGIKWAINSRMNFNFEISHRFTTTDYLDDVSSVYAGLSAFPAGSPASLLQDRSYETGNRIGLAGSQRGFGNQKDQYIMAMMGLTFNITSYKCPSSN